LCIIQLSAQKSALIVDLEQRLSNEKSQEIQIKILLDLSHLYSSIDQSLSLDYAEKALLITNATKSLEDRVKALTQIGRIELNKNNYDVALETFIKALDINKEISNLAGVAKCRLLMGDVYKKIGDKRWAKREYETALQIGIKTKSSYITALSNYSLGILEKSLGNKKLALQLLELSNEQINEEENPKLQADVFRGLGQLYIDLGRPNQGIRAFRNSLQQYIVVDSAIYNGVSSNQAEVNFELAKAYELIDDNVNFLVYMESSLKISEKLALKNYIKKGYKNLAKAYELNKDYRKAYEFLQYYAAIKDVGEITFLESQLELAKKNQELILFEEKEKSEDEIKFTRNLFFAVILILLLVFSGFLLYAYRQKTAINKELELATLQSNKLRKDKEDFFAYTSHEIRTPLNAVVGLSHLMSETKLNTKQQDYLNIIKSSANNILFLVNDILDLSKFEKGAIQLEQIPFSLINITNDITKSVAFKTKNKPVEIISKLGVGIPPALIGDPMRINQILLNLVDNAIKFTEKGSVTVSIKPASDYEISNKLNFSIKDTGIGIKKGKLATIFDSYEQASSNTSRQYGGTGLGLAITRELVRLMGGEIKVASNPGKGSEFSFALCLSKSEFQEPSTLSWNECFDFNGLSILLVDDNELNRVVLNELIQNMKQDISLSFAEDGLVAVKMVKETDFDLILMDLQMPNMNGFEATEFIRTRLPNKKNRVPIIAMTAHVLDGVAKKCMEIGMNDCLSKPVKTELLFKKIASILNIPQKGEHIEKKENQIISSNNKQNVTNLSLIKKISKDNPIKILKYLSIYLENVPADLKKLNHNLKKENYKEVISIAHKIKGNVSYLGVESVLSDLSALEKLNGDEVNTNEITIIANRVNGIITQSIEELKKHVLEYKK
jgi:signal transduction histidine kinase/DNA-binding response OmpR family regulator